MKLTKAGAAENTYTLSDASTGLFVSYCDGSCAGGKWLLADYKEASEAIPLQLVPAGATPSEDWGYCRSADREPEQINIQISGPRSVVVSFVTFEPEVPSKAPSVRYRLGTQPNSTATTATGVTHIHVTSQGDRTYYMHFVSLTGLTERASYLYRAQSGGAAAPSSAEFRFRAGYSSGVTRIAIYGDMGVYTWNNMQNLQNDITDGAADLIVHMGDHAYNEGEDDERRADG